MKSFNAAVKESEDLDLRYAEPNVLHLVVSPNRARMFTDASPKVRGLYGPKSPEAAMGVVLMVPTASEPNCVSGPHAEPSHTRLLMVATVPPLDRS